MALEKPFAMLNTFFHGGEEERPEARLQSLIGEKVRPVRSAGLDELTELNRVLWERKENLLSKIILRPLSVCGCVLYESQIDGEIVMREERENKREGGLVVI